MSSDEGIEAGLMMQTIQEQAIALANRSAQVNPLTLHTVWWFEDAHERDVCMVYVGDWLMSDVVKLQAPVGVSIFDANPHRLATWIEMRPEQWDSVLSNELSLPNGWNKDKAVCIYERPNDALKMAWLGQITEMIREARKEGATNEELLTAMGVK